ncbi:MAG: barstar family protein [Atopobiaceae bacterium]|jgi:RNAse (barnase) inhibitor barstar|nr:barstar family protein [Atopobiaceae bacterium]
MTGYRKVVLREKELESPQETHKLLATELKFPEYYGANLDALEDSLEDIREPTRIVIKRSKSCYKPWFDGFEEVIRDVALQSCYLGCIVR